MNRRGLLAGALSLAAIETPGKTLAQSVERFRAGATPIEGDALIWLAQSQGYFSRAGIQLDIQALTSGAAIGAAIVGGSLAIGSMNTMSLAVAHQNGVGLKIIAAGPEYISGKGGSQLMVKADSTINSGADLNGKTVAVNELHGSAQISAEAWIDKHGGNSQTVQWIELPFAAMQAALEAGRIAAGAVAQPWATSALTTCRSLGPPNDAIAPEFLVAVYVAKGSWITAHRNAARRIRSALSTCAHWYDTDPAASVGAVAALTKQDPAVVAKSARSFFGERVTPALVQPVIDAGARYGILKASFPATDIIAQL